MLERCLPATTKVEVQGTSGRVEVDDEGSLAHEHSGDDESHQDEDPRHGKDLQQVSWSFNSADSQRENYHRLACTPHNDGCRDK